MKIGLWPPYVGPYILQRGGWARFRMFGWPTSNGKHLVVDLYQIVGGKRWSLSLTRTIKLADEEETR